MKIIYVDYQYHYGNADLGLNSIAVEGFIPSFVSLGHQVVPFFYDALTSDACRLNRALVEFCDAHKPDLVFYVLAHDLFDKSILSGVSAKYTTVNFFGDDHWRFESFTSKLAHSFTYCATTDPFAIKKYNEIGYDNVILTQWAAIKLKSKADEIIMPKYKYNVSFIGGSNHYRNWFIEYLTESGVDVECFGVGWPSGTVTSDEMANIFNLSKINLNISNSRSYDLRFLRSMPFKFVRQLRSVKAASQVKARNFEIPACNGFQLTDYVPFLEKYLEIGKEVICYNSPEEAVRLIDFYLANECEREAVKVSSREKVINKHCYINRVKSILDEIYHS